MIGKNGGRFFKMAGGLAKLVLSKVGDPFFEMSLAAVRPTATCEQTERCEQNQSTL